MGRPSLLRKLITLGCCAAVLIMSLMLWDATGRAYYTQQFDAERAKREAENTNNLANLFGDGPAGAEASIEAVPNRFALGLLPSTEPWNITNPDLVSVMTISTPALLIALLQIVPQRSTRRLLSMIRARGAGGGSHKTGAEPA